ncbi:MAG: hypothetical protein WD225_00590, partial [Ilumatobacteraceae bacterium]
ALATRLIGSARSPSADHFDHGDGSTAVRAARRHIERTISSELTASAITERPSLSWFSANPDATSCAATPVSNECQLFTRNDR